MKCHFKSPRVSCLSLLCLLTFIPLYAQENSQKAEVATESELFRPLQLKVYLGYQGLRSHEYVVDKNANSRGHLSELIWNSFKNLLFGGSVSGHFKHFSYLLQVSSTVSLDKNYIYNYDWLYAKSITEDGPSNYSRHEIDQKLMLESLLRIGFPLFQTHNSKIILGPGLFFSYNKWEGSDGRLVYYINNTQASTPGRNLGYTVALFAPQLYLDFIQNFGRILELQLTIAYSPLTIWFDMDNHYNRNLFFFDYGFFGQQVFGDIQLNFWNKQRSFAIGIGVSGRYLFETRGGVDTYDADEDGKPKDKRSSKISGSGIEQGSFQVYLGVTLAFPPKKKSKKK